MKESKLFHPSSRPSGQGITIGTPRFYDLSASLLFGGARRRSYRRLMAAAGVRRGDRALDVGCGPGYLARMLAEAVGPMGSVVGIDAAPEMIEYASRKARRLSNCRFQAGTAEGLAFPDASFDAVLSSLMMHHLPDGVRLQAVGEMSVCCAPGAHCSWPTSRSPTRAAGTSSLPSPAMPTARWFGESRRSSRWSRRRASPICSRATCRPGCITSARKSHEAVAPYLLADQSAQRARHGERPRGR